MSTDPAIHIIAVGTGCTVDDIDYLYDLYDLYALYDLSEVCELLNFSAPRKERPLWR